MLCYCLIVLLLPAGLLVIGSFMRIYGFFDIANPFTLRHWQIVLNDSIFWPSVRNTLVLAIGAAVLSVTMYAALAFMLVRGHVRFRGAITLLGWLPWAIPGVLVGIALVQTFLAVPFLSVVYGSMAALILARLIASMPLSLQMFQSSIQQIHKELDECSSVVGASSVTTFRKIIFPLIAPMAVSVGVIAFIGAARDISTLVLLSNNATRPLSVLMLEYSIGGELERGAVVGVITTALVVGVALIARRFGLGLRGL